MKLMVPRYVRISRVIRDIPGDDIADGNLVTNLRELISQKMSEKGLKCKCIRCREIGHNKKLKIKSQKLKVFIDKYKTLGGEEYFISIEDTKRTALFAFVRLRLPKNQDKTLVNLMPEIYDSAFVRELHTYGHLVPVDGRLKGASQHTGFGKRLMQETEIIAKKEGYKKMAVISGIGVRAYYKKLGYRLKGTYMLKSL